MPRIRSEVVGTADQSWLGTTHGIYNCITATIDPAGFKKDTHYPKGYLPSGLPVNFADLGAVKPYTGAAGEKLGFLYTDQPMDGVAKIAVPVLTHGTVKKAKLPVVLATTSEPQQTAAFVLI